MAVITTLILVVLTILFLRSLLTGNRLKNNTKALGAPNPMSKCPISVNYHFNRQCNKTCRFCFFTELTSHMEDIDDAKKGLLMLKKAGMKKLNFAGGEPFLNAKFMGTLIEYCKVDLGLESISIVSNGSLIKEKWLARYGQHIDILAISCDSFDENINIEIGRGSGDNVQQLRQIRDWCEKYQIKFKINTVVCNLNKGEDMNDNITSLQPFRWKCFQCLLVPGENDSEETLRDARDLLITDEEFDRFCTKHENQPSFVPESNKVMSSSYLILDEYMRFLDRDGASHSGKIIDVGVEQALSQIYWDEESFQERGGVYDWTRQQDNGCGTAPASAIEW